MPTDDFHKILKQASKLSAVRAQSSLLQRRAQEISVNQHLTSRLVVDNRVVSCTVQISPRIGAFKRHRAAVLQTSAERAQAYNSTHTVGRSLLLKARFHRRSTQLLASRPILAEGSSRLDPDQRATNGAVSCLQPHILSRLAFTFTTSQNSLLRRCAFVGPPNHIRETLQINH